MTREEVLEKVEDIMSSPSIRIVANATCIKVYKICYLGNDRLVLTIYDDMVELDGICHSIKEEIDG